MIPGLEFDTRNASTNAGEFRVDPPRPGLVFLAEDRKVNDVPPCLILSFLVRTLVARQK
jgi:hypothetical protein